MHKHFTFLGVHAQHVKVNQGPFVGLPSITGLTGLARAFAMQLAEYQDLEPCEFQPDGVCLAVENYELHAGYVKAHKGSSAIYEAKPAVWASFSANFVFRLRAATPRAVDVLASQDLSEDAANVLTELTLCKGKLIVERRPVNLASKRLVERYPNELDRAMAVLPSRALVLRDESALVEAARSEGLALMDTLVAATLRHDDRPQPYREFFENQGCDERRLAPVLSGYLALEAEPSARSTRADVNGRLAASRVTSPMFSLTCLQTAASVRASVLDQPDNGYGALWKEQPLDGSYVCLAAA